MPQPVVAACRSIRLLWKTFNWNVLLAAGIFGCFDYITFNTVLKYILWSSCHAEIALAGCVWPSGVLLKGREPGSAWHRSAEPQRCSILVSPHVLWTRLSWISWIVGALQACVFISKRKQKAVEESTCLLEMAVLFLSAWLSGLCAWNSFSPHVRF